MFYDPPQRPRPEAPPEFNLLDPSFFAPFVGFLPPHLQTREAQNSKQRVSLANSVFLLADAGLHFMVPETVTASCAQLLHNRINVADEFPDPIKQDSAPYRFIIELFEYGTGIDIVSAPPGDTTLPATTWNLLRRKKHAANSDIEYPEDEARIPIKNKRLDWTGISAAEQIASLPETEIGYFNHDPANLKMVCERNPGRREKIENVSMIEVYEILKQLDLLQCIGIQPFSREKFFGFLRPDYPTSSNSIIRRGMDNHRTYFQRRPLFRFLEKARDSLLTNRQRGERGLSVPHSQALRPAGGRSGSHDHSRNHGRVCGISTLTLPRRDPR